LGLFDVGEELVGAHLWTVGGRFLRLELDAPPLLILHRSHPRRVAHQDVRLPAFSAQFDLDAAVRVVVEEELLLFLLSLEDLLLAV
jgi:hypothetical protein